MVKGELAFNQFYGEVYKERWPKLKRVLTQEREKFSLENPFYSSANLGQGLKQYYYLDFASVLAARSLEVKKNDRILDLCSAPGGKALTLLFEHPSENLDMTLNELSGTRRTRLYRVLDEYLPSDKRSMVKVTGHDASGWCLYETQAYDRILLDVPCSSEAHLLGNPGELSHWAPGRSKRLAKNQWTMLAGAFLVLKPGGRLVYSTCSISPLENDLVVEKLVKKFSHELKINLDFFQNQGEPTSHGIQFLPDKGGLGPLYVSVIDKKS